MSCLKKEKQANQINTPIKHSNNQRVQRNIPNQSSSAPVPPTFSPVHPVPPHMPLTSGCSYPCLTFPIVPPLLPAIRRRLQEYPGPFSLQRIQGKNFNILTEKGNVLAVFTTSC